MSASVRKCDRCTCPVLSYRQSNLLLSNDLGEHVFQGFGHIRCLQSERRDEVK